MIRKALKDYIENNILSQYELNDEGHNINHANYVIKRSLKFASNLDVNPEMVYVIAAYHDVAHHIDRLNHEKIGSEILLNDKELTNYFTKEEIKTMSDAVYDHRSSLKGDPRTIYGKIVSTADRNISVDATLKRSYSYNRKHYQELTNDEVFEQCRLFLNKKYGKNGYAVEKFYFEDKDYDKYLIDMDYITTHKEEFYKRIKKVNNLGE